MKCKVTVCFALLTASAKSLSRRTQTAIMNDHKTESSSKAAASHSTTPMATSISQLARQEPLVAQSPVTRKPIPRRNSLIPCIKRWAVSINNDSEKLRRQLSNLQTQRRKSMDDQTLNDKHNLTTTDTWYNDNQTETGPHRGISRRASLDVDVERAVAMVNEYPELEKDDKLLSPFGNRRDSLL
jgi:hypothetical protein